MGNDFLPINTGSQINRQSTNPVTPEKAYLQAKEKTLRHNAMVRKPTDLPIDHFKDIPNLSAAQALREAQWCEVRDLSFDDMRRILYLRRFTDEIPNLSRLNPLLRVVLADPLDSYGFYQLDTTRFGELEPEIPYKATLQIPEGVKIGIVIGYHFLEKPWSRLVMKAVQEQTNFPPGAIEFIIVNNNDIPTGDPSTTSEAEVRAAIAQKGITHVIDLHEHPQTDEGYMPDIHPLQFHSSNRYPVTAETTLDPYVPAWMLEAYYYHGLLYPQLQRALNQQIQTIEGLVAR